MLCYQQNQNYFKLLYAKIHNNLHFLASLVSLLLFFCNISTSEEMLFLMGLFCLSLHLVHIFYLFMPEIWDCAEVPFLVV